MKKFFKFLPLLVAAVAGFAAVSCSDDDKEEVIVSEQLPASARSFISTYYPDATIVTAKKDKDDYEVLLSDGTKIDFTLAGEWKDVDAMKGKTIPAGFYPAEIDTYVQTNFPGVGINEISKDSKGYDVGLVNGSDLLFNSDGSFAGLDR